MILAVAASAMLLEGSAVSQSRPSTFRTSVNLVVIHPSVVDGAGRHLTDLRQDEFRVFDNGVAVPVASFSSDARPFTAVMLLDMSESMAAHLWQVREGAQGFVDALLDADRLRIGSFGAEVSLSPFLTADKAILKRVLREELWPGGGTPMWSAILAAARSLREEEGRRTIIVLTDGVDSSGTDADLVTRVKQENIPLSAVGLDSGGLSKDLREVVMDTGGSHRLVRRDGDLRAAFDNIAHELRHQYLIGFQPTINDGAVHTLTVTVTRPKVTVRAPRVFVARGLQ
jgi:Ca-activated chloride channel homolog